MTEISIAQMRAARSLLNWTQTDLALAANVAVPTIKRYETSARTPMPAIMASIRRSLEGAGVEFIPAKNGKGVGVRLKEDK
jgi:transcriptional regulator with XRE-family HTH domain